MEGNAEGYALMVSLGFILSEKSALIEPGHHRISCGGELEFDVPSGFVYKFRYWGP
ncbi:hypothetical protein HDF10_000299 [Edaphobacter lichenicola]|uniref:Uncharacterized protein n=1 Tax=Tunturiibacter lichenicola TaxID=2051959 RepID=A0A7W8N1V5_9BACT|nr:hypothetical protein [Edaphobacter lichenicola]